MTELLKPEQVAILLNISKVTVYRLVERGQLKAHKIGGQLRFKQGDIDSYLQNASMDDNNAIPSKSVA